MMYFRDNNNIHLLLIHSVVRILERWAVDRMWTRDIEHAVLSSYLSFSEKKSHNI